jgi:hypothetical protein
MVRDGALRLLTMRVDDFAAIKTLSAANEVLILRSPPLAGVSKDGHEDTAQAGFLPTAIVSHDVRRRGTD